MEFIKTYGVYEIKLHEENKIVANVIAQVVENNDLGGYTLHGEYGTITQDEKGVTITGKVPQDMQSDILREFNEIVNNFNNN